MDTDEKECTLSEAESKDKVGKVSNTTSKLKIMPSTTKNSKVTMSFNTAFGKTISLKPAVDAKQKSQVKIQNLYMQSPKMSINEILVQKTATKEGTLKNLSIV
jgi:hypothetical protein